MVRVPAFLPIDLADIRYTGTLDQAKGHLLLSRFSNKWQSVIEQHCTQAIKQTNWLIQCLRQHSVFTADTRITGFKVSNRTRALILLMLLCNCNILVRGLHLTPQGSFFNEPLWRCVYCLWNCSHFGHNRHSLWCSLLITEPCTRTFKHASI